MSKNTEHTYIYPGAEVATDIATSFGHFIFALPQRLTRLLVIWQKRTTERHHLRMMDDYRLKDAGMTRSDVRQETDKPFWKI